MQRTWGGVGPTFYHRPLLPSKVEGSLGDPAFVSRVFHQSSCAMASPCPPESPDTGISLQISSSAVTIKQDTDAVEDVCQMAEGQVERALVGQEVVINCVKLLRSSSVSDAAASFTLRN